MGYDMIGIEGNVIMSTELQFVFGDYSRFIESDLSLLPF